MNIDIICDECNRDLKFVCNIATDIFRITPCKGCIKESYDEGYRDAEEDRDEQKD